MRQTHYPPERNRVPTHLTLFAHLPPTIERELGARLAASTAIAPPQARVTGILDLGSGTAFRIESDDLEEIRDDLANAFHGLLTPQDMAPWNPHVTIQNKVDRRAATRLQARLGATFRPRPLAIKGLASWRYLGGSWEPLRRHAFRG